MLINAYKRSVPDDRSPTIGKVQREAVGSVEGSLIPKIIRWNVVVLVPGQCAPVLTVSRPVMPHRPWVHGSTKYSALQAVLCRSAPAAWSSGLRLYRVAKFCLGFKPTKI